MVRSLDAHTTVGSFDSGEGNGCALFLQFIEHTYNYSNLWMKLFKLFKFVSKDHFGINVTASKFLTKNDVDKGIEQDLEVKPP